ncbi:hypothetical protein HWV62_21972 [Athelia sp. TMB]|nr:hypothetical protein HWV62_21972 [Athelia sp. TMB]
MKGGNDYSLIREMLIRDGVLKEAQLQALHPKHKRTIRTLIPSKLSSSDYMTLSGCIRPTIYFQGSTSIFAYTHRESSIPFPDAAHGFLYFHAPAEDPKAAWQIRFRVTDSDSPESFRSGSDLRYPNGTTWFITPSWLSEGSKNVCALRKVLIHDGYFDSLATKEVRRSSGPMSVPKLHALGQPFRVDLHKTHLDLQFLGPTQIARIRGMRTPFGRWWVGSLGRQFSVQPYAGEVLCCFEAYKTPSITQPDTLVLRLLKFLSPITIAQPEVAHMVPMPQEGGLAMKYTAKAGDLLISSHDFVESRPWMFPAPTVVHPVIQALIHGNTGK